VAAETGFATPSHFSRAYRSAFGRSPRQERQGAGPPSNPPAWRPSTARRVRATTR
jgi:AraC-like DNA-binding protein